MRKLPRNDALGLSLAELDVAIDLRDARDAGDLAVGVPFDRDRDQLLLKPLSSPSRNVFVFPVPIRS